MPVVPVMHMSFIPEHAGQASSTTPSQSLSSPSHDFSTSSYVAAVPRHCQPSLPAHVAVVPVEHTPTLGHDGVSVRWSSMTPLLSLSTPSHISQVKSLSTTPSQSLSRPSQLCSVSSYLADV